MTGNSRKPQTVLFFGLDDALATELTSVLSPGTRVIYAEARATVAECIRLIERLPVQIVFSAGERRQYMALLEAVRRKRPGIPVVVLSRHPEVSEWLDALEAGATDYCAAPFEVRHVQWILENSMLARQAATA